MDAGWLFIDVSFVRCVVRLHGEVIHRDSTWW
jgi:hypothetical protein